MIDEDEINFCLSKCVEGGYCSYMKGKGGFPCLEYICEFCDNPHNDNKYCKFCKGKKR